MKYLFILLFTTIGYSQLSVYVPLKTYHFNRTDEVMMKAYADGEGGNIGAIFIYQLTNTTIYQQINAGGLRNSYGDASFTVSYGVGHHFNDLDVNLNIGLISGYKTLYDLSYNLREIMPKTMVKMGVIPSTILSVSYTKYRIQPKLLINPSFINIGIAIDLSYNTKIKKILK